MTAVAEMARPGSAAARAGKISASPRERYSPSHKLPLRAYLAAIAIFCNEVKGKSMLAMSRDLGLSYKAAFVLCHKMREAMAQEMKGRMVGGNGKTAEVDAGFFGGYRKPANLAENRADRRLARNQNWQAESRHHRSRAQRQFRPGGVPVRRCRPGLG